MVYLVRTLNGFKVTTNQQQAIQELQDKRGIDRANDQQNYEEAYARGEI